MKKLLRQLPKALLLLLVTLAFVQVNAQKRLAPLLLPDFQFNISNDVQTAPNVLEFDLYLLDTDASQPFEASIVQVGLLINKSCLNGGTPTITIVSGTSEMSSGMLPANGTYASINTTLGILKIAGRSLPGCTFGTVLGTTAPGTKFGHWKITNSVNFVTNSQAGLTFDFSSSVPHYKTSIYQYQSCVSVALTTSASNCFGVNYANIHLNPPPAATAYAMTGGGAYCDGATLFPAVGLSNSQTGVTYTLYQDGIAQTPTYSGITGSPIAMGNWPGTFTYSVVGVGNGTNFSATPVPMSTTVLVTKNPTPVITFNPLADVCVGTGLVSLAATPSGGLYSGNIYLSGSTFNPSTVGTYPITYNFSNGFGCAAAPVTQNITVKVCTPTWSGLAMNNEWTTPGNWLGNNVPAADGDAIIPAGCPSYPIIFTGEVVHIGNLTVSGTGAKSTLSGGMTITGELIIGGNLTITSTGSVDITADGALTISGNLSIVGTLLIESSGSMITNGNVTGNATIQRVVPNNLSWHFLSSPVSAQPICNGVFAPSYPGTFPGDINTWDFYNWLPGECDANQHWRNLRKPSGSTPNNVDFPLLQFMDSRGYLVAYLGTGWSPTKSFFGPPNTADRDLAFYDVTNSCSWALPGNPYPSAVKWSDVLLKENLVSPYYYIWDDVSQNYAWYGDPAGLPHAFGPVDGNIPAEQGFFIKVLPPSMGGTLHLQIPNSARVHDNNPDMWIKDAAANSLSLTITNGTQYNDVSFVRFENNCSIGQDRYDAEKMFSMNAAVPQIYTIINNDLKACSNSLPYVNNGTTVPVGFIAPVEGSYSITVGNMSSFSSSLTGLSLEDLQLNINQDLLQNPVYNFTATGNEDAGRFLLHFAGAIGIDTKDNSPINIYSNEKTVYITCAAGFQNAQVTISNLLGQEILSQNLSDQKTNQVKVNALKGYYIVKVQNASSVKTAKVFIN
jgi:hypothetical protein